ncbi:19847_t:CDS:1, partial [Racocetra persica]
PQQDQLKILKKEPKVNSQDLLNNSLIIDIEDTNINFYLEKEFDKEPLQISAEAEDIDMENKLTIENLFKIQI